MADAPITPGFVLAIGVVELEEVDDVRGRILRGPPSGSGAIVELNEGAEDEITSNDLFAPLELS